jgi:carbamoyl-phosphate synthase large subunit
MIFTCVGRRVELLRAFRRAAEGLDIDLEVHGADISWTAPGMHLVDKGHIVPRIDSGRYVDALLEIVARKRIRLLVPLIDTELLVLAEAAERFTGAGCLALVSSADVVRTCTDKLATFRCLHDAGIDTPMTWAWKERLEAPSHAFPYYMKPRFGSAGKGNYKITSMEELWTLGRRVEEPIVQEFVDGVEHTMDVYTGLDGIPRCAVPRRRLEVRTGEVSKGLIVKDAEIMGVGLRVAGVLGGCRGVVTVQCMVTPDRRIRAIEVNPRFGGGVPLAIHAGADFPKWILMELTGRKPRINPTGFKGDVGMLRFDDSVFVPNASKRWEL